MKIQERVNCRQIFRSVHGVYMLFRYEKNNIKPDLIFIKNIDIKEDNINCFKTLHTKSGAIQRLNMNTYDYDQIAINI